jgi:hypothetical protein
MNIIKMAYVVFEEVDIENFCYIGFGGSLPPADRNATVIGEGAAVPTYTAIGQECKVLPRSGPDDFTISVVPSGSVVTRRPVNGGTNHFKL